MSKSQKIFMKEAWQNIKEFLRPDWRKACLAITFFAVGVLPVTNRFTWIYANVNEFLNINCTANVTYVFHNQTECKEYESSLCSCTKEGKIPISDCIVRCEAEIYEIGFPFYLVRAHIFVMDFYYYSLVPNILFWYFLSCLVVWVIDKLRGRLF